MEIVKIKSLHLVNFKGICELDINFDSQYTIVQGRNGTGKTTVFDAFTWLLFGKDSKNRTDFQIKTLDADGNPIPRLPHEVSAILEVNGNEITLRRVYKEKWVKKRGEIEEQFNGHGEEYYFNDVPCARKEYNAKVNEICNEDVFKYITNPAYFLSENAMKQRALLIEMAGGIDNTDVAAGNKDFEALIAQVDNKTIDEYKKEISAKKSHLKSEIEGLPERIDERNRDIEKYTLDESGNEIDWIEVEEKLKTKSSELKSLEDMMYNKSRAVTEASKHRLKLISQLDVAKNSRGQLKFAIQHRLLSEGSNIKYRQEECLRVKEECQARINEARSRLSEFTQKLERLSEERKQLVAKWREIKSRELVFSADEFTCPICGRKLEWDEVVAKQDEMIANFNSRKADELKKNVELGKAVKQEMENVQEYIDKCNAIIEQQNGLISQKDAEITELTKHKQPSLETECANDAEYQRLTAEIDSLTEQLEKMPTESEIDSTMQEQKRTLTLEIEKLTNIFARKDIILRNEERIEELEQSMKTLNVELAKLEGVEYIVKEFSKARIRKIEDKVNQMFKIVKFKMFANQVNGAEVETCEAMINGVPYNRGLNNAHQVLAGLDIINAICNFKGIYAPIMIDNAESINILPEMTSQVVALKVTDDKVLNVVTETA